MPLILLITDAYNLCSSGPYRENGPLGLLLQQKVIWNQVHLSNSGLESKLTTVPILRKLSIQAFILIWRKRKNTTTRQSPYTPILIIHSRSTSCRPNPSLYACDHTFGIVFSLCHRLAILPHYLATWLECAKFGFVCRQCNQRPLDTSVQVSRTLDGRAVVRVCLVTVIRVLELWVVFILGKIFMWLKNIWTLFYCNCVTIVLMLPVTTYINARGR